MALANALNCSPRSSMFLNRSKLAQHGLSNTVSPGFASSWQAATQSFMLWVSRTGMPSASKLSCNFWLSAPRDALELAQLLQTMLYAREVTEPLVQGFMVDAYDVASQTSSQTVVDVVLAAEAHVSLWHFEG